MIPTSKKILLLVFFIYFPFVQPALADLDPLSVWHERPSTFSHEDVVYGNGVFVSLRYLGFQGAHEIMISSDGITWEITGTTLCSEPVLSFANGRFFVGDCSTVLVSTDGRNWVRHAIPWVWASNQIFGETAYGNGIYVALGDSGPVVTGDSSTVLTSTDGVTWSRTNTGSVVALNSIAYGNGIFVAVGRQLNDVRLGGLLTSSDGITWTERTPEGTPLLHGIAFGKNSFVAIGTVYGWAVIGSRILTSQDGINWSSEFHRNIGLDDLAYGNGVFAVRDISDETLLTSPDGEHWTQRFNDRVTPGSLSNYAPMTFGNDTFLLFGENYLLQSDPFFGPGVSTDISVNGQDIRPSITQGDPVSVEINISTEVPMMTGGDWWVVASTPMGWYYYIYLDGWHSATSLENVQPAYQGPLPYPFFSLTVLNQSSSSLSPGIYTVYFGVDLTTNGQIDYERLFFDYAQFYIYVP